MSFKSPIPTVKIKTKVKGETKYILVRPEETRVTIYGRIIKTGKLRCIRLCVGDGGLITWICAIVQMHPELCVADTTFGTNNNKKELFTLAFKDGNNNVFNGARAYIPNAQKCVFHMMFKEYQT